MIYINNEEYTVKNFPDGTLAMSFKGEKDCIYLRWNYQNEGELVTIMYLTKYLQSFGCEVHLIMPYIPNARMDRVNENEIFTLKYFAEVINSLNFKTVTVLDPHSNVAPALLNNVRVKTPEDFIENAIVNIIINTTEKKLNKNMNAYLNGDIDMFDLLGDEVEQSLILDNYVLCYPDAGAQKRYEDYFPQFESCCGLKKRKNGRVEKLDIINAEKVKGKTVLIIDDICSYGTTFYYTAKALKEAGAKDVYLYVTHCENSATKGRLLEDNYIKKIFTTDSIFSEKGWASTFIIVGEIR